MDSCCEKNGTACSVCKCKPCTCHEDKHKMWEKKKEAHLQWSQGIIDVRKKMLTAIGEDDDDKRDALLKEALQKEIDMYQHWIDHMKNGGCCG